MRTSPPSLPPSSTPSSTDAPPRDESRHLLPLCHRFIVWHLCIEHEGIAVLLCAPFPGSLRGAVWISQVRLTGGSCVGETSQWRSVFGWCSNSIGCDLASFRRIGERFQFGRSPPHGTPTTFPHAHSICSAASDDACRRWVHSLASHIIVANTDCNTAPALAHSQPRPASTSCRRGMALTGAKRPVRGHLPDAEFHEFRPIRCRGHLRWLPAIFRLLPYSGLPVIRRKWASGGCVPSSVRRSERGQDHEFRRSRATTIRHLSARHARLALAM